MPNMRSREDGNYWETRITPRDDNGVCDAATLTVRHHPAWEGAQVDLRFKMDDGDYFSKSVDAAAARALRDALIEIYPVETPKEKPTRYVVRNTFEVFREVVKTSPDFEWLATAEDAEAAQRIADALNAQETA